MAEWRDSILRHFRRGVARLTLVADPDGLLAEERMLAAIERRGFDLIPFEDPAAFRFAYESRYRSRWDEGLETGLVAVLRSPERRLDQLPHDLLTAGRRLDFALHNLFPKLSYPVLCGIDRSLLDDIDREYREYDGERMTERQTKEFLLMNCFGIVPKLIRTPVDLLKDILSLHARRIRLPEVLGGHLVDSLEKAARFEGWPLAAIVPDRDAFLRFLQDEWGLYLGSFDDPTIRSRVPFAHEDVRAYIDTLFLDGELAPVRREEVSGLPDWVRTGVVHDPAGDALRRYRRLLGRFEAELPTDEASHRAWEEAARRWAELVVLRWEWEAAFEEADRAAWESAHVRVEEEFGRWMLARYGTLYNLPHHPRPVMVHQIPRFLAGERGRDDLARVALVVLDGLALDQWLLLRRRLEADDPRWRFQESAAFAWVPTVTTVSRQSIFAGEPPLYFPESLGTTSREPARWRRFWEDQGLDPSTTDLVANLKASDDPRLEAALANPHLAVLGLIWNQVDDLADSAQLGTAGLHNQVRLWADQGHLGRLLGRLDAEGFRLYLTADHGNVPAVGIGSPREGVLVETKGRRARIYERPEFREEVAARYPGTVRWPGHGLPPDRHVLLAGGLGAFTGEGDRIVAHGGIALEEVLVPFVSIRRDDS